MKSSQYQELVQTWLEKLSSGEGIEYLYFLEREYLQCCPSLIKRMKFVSSFGHGAGEDDSGLISKSFISNELPILIVAGGCSESDSYIQERYLQIFRQGLAGFRGIIISGGTAGGVSGLAGSLSDTCKTIGYAPSIAELSPAYKEIVKTKGKEFSILEPLQMWVDIISSGVQKSQIKLIGINGGFISSFEYKLALALGVEAGLIVENGKSSYAEIIADPAWSGKENLHLLSSEKQIAIFLQKCR